MMRTFLILGIGVAVATSFVFAQSPYAGQEHRPVKSLSAAETEALRNGDGMGFAMLAELNHYPGPKHVLELAPEIELTPSQLADTERLFAEMRGKARAIGEELLEAEARLDRAFAQGVVDAKSLRAALLELGEIRARLRYVHLEAHLRQRDMLTEQQVAAYDRLRGYGRKDLDHSQHSHDHE